MSENGQAPGPAQRGRYALYAQPDGPVIPYTIGLCDRCANCGCGEQAAEPIDFTMAGRARMIGQIAKLAADSGAVIPRHLKGVMRLMGVKPGGE